ncbi:NUDIX domain-containing protein [Myroides sp. DW712]|uniref:NUDIX domain-containing protein n=1 Tax=Myroides sp. DW712 TaxID=3389800 RepID=UPI00397ABE0F
MLTPSILQLTPATSQDVDLIVDFMTQAEAFSFVEKQQIPSKKELLAFLDQQVLYLVYEAQTLCGCFGFRMAYGSAQLTYVYVVSVNQKQSEALADRLLEEAKKQAFASSINYLTVVATPVIGAFYEKRGAKPAQVENENPGVVEYYLSVVNQPWIDLPTAGLVCVKGNQLLLAFSKNKQAWYLPGGKIDPGEHSQQALIREIEEELSLVLQEERLTFLTHIVAPAYGEKKNILMQQDCYAYDLANDTITIANEIGGVQYFTKEDYIRNQIPVPGVLKVFDFL